MAEQPPTLTVPQALDLAVAHHKAGRLTEAETLYQQVLEIEPEEPTAIHMLGLLAHQTGQHNLAIELIGRALELEPELAEVIYDSLEFAKVYEIFDKDWKDVATIVCLFAKKLARRYVRCAPNSGVAWGF